MQPSILLPNTINILQNISNKVHQLNSHVLCMIRVAPTPTTTALEKLKPHLSLVFDILNFCQCYVWVLIMYFLGIHLINMPENDSQPPINRCCYVGVVPCMCRGQNWLMLSGDSFNQLLCFVFFLHSSSAINFKFVASKSFFCSFLVYVVGDKSSNVVSIFKVVVSIYTYQYHSAPKWKFFQQSYE